MKKLALTAIILGSTGALAACASNTGYSEDVTYSQAPYAEERTVGSTGAVAAPVVRSAQPVFEETQMK
ncbi:MAG: hypothetical protein AAF549_03850 [Pseudomonadota bacterium]